MWITSPAAVPNRAGVPTDICGSLRSPARVVGCFSPPQTPASFPTHLCKCNYSCRLVQTHLHTPSSCMSTESLMSLFILRASQSRTCSAMDSQVGLTLLFLLFLREELDCTLRFPTKRALNCSSRTLCRKTDYFLEHK